MAFNAFLVVFFFLVLYLVGVQDVLDRQVCKFLRKMLCLCSLNKSHNSDGVVRMKTKKGRGQDVLQAVMKAKKNVEN